MADAAMCLPAPKSAALSARLGNGTRALPITAGEIGAEIADHLARDDLEAIQEIGIDHTGRAAENHMIKYRYQVSAWESAERCPLSADRISGMDSSTTRYDLTCHWIPSAVPLTWPMSPDKTASPLLEQGFLPDRTPRLAAQRTKQFQGSAMPELENRIVAHHVGARGFGVALN